MSFKREGNDKSLLDNLRHRRIKDLIAESIPLDEAKLLCNGRFACMVCSFRPVFDTVDMLLVHRKGKKHTANAEEFAKEKKKLADMTIKRHHEQYMKDGITNIAKAAPTSYGGINPFLPYDPRVKKAKLKPYERKARLQYGEGSPGSRAFPESSALALGPVRHSHQLKNIFRPSVLEVPTPQPYVSKRSIKNSTVDSPRHAFETSATAPSATATHEIVSEKAFADFSGIHTSSSDCKTTPECCSLGLSSHFLSVPDQRTPPLFRNGVCQQSTGKHALAVRQDVSERMSSPEECRFNAMGADCSDKESGHISKCPSNQASSKSASEEKHRAAQKYLQIMGSGWKKDWDGKWIRDENAEFDSDEEPPDIP